MKNYYEILEVSQHASQEVIEKAYKALAKKYHPDLQPEDKKKEAENKIKEVNEAFEILSNKEKKASYDRELNLEKMKEAKRQLDEQNRTSNNTTYNQTNSVNNIPYKKTVKPPNSINNQNNIRNTNNINHTNSNNINQYEYENRLNEQLNRAYKDAYKKAYIQNLKNMGYTIKYQKTFKEQVKYVLSIISFVIILIFVCFILWHIPFVKNYLINLYNSSPTFKLLADIFINIFSNFINIFKR